MSYRFQMQPSGKLVLVVFEGEISPDEERQAVVDFVARAGAHLNADILVDRSRATMTVQPADVARQLHVVKTNFPRQDRRPRLAIVAPSDVDFGMARMLELSGGDDLPHRVMVVRGLEDACGWLGVDVGDIIWPQ